MSLKHVLVKSQQGIVKRLLHARLGGYEEKRSKKVIHASELTHVDTDNGKNYGYCPRLARLTDLYPEIREKPQHVGSASAVTYATGRDIQARLNNEWLRDLMVGDWKCASCGAERKFQRAPTGGCNNGNVKCRWEYEEVRIEDAITGASGGLDALIAVGQGRKLRVIECKIIDKDYYKALEAPMAEHRVRTKLYLRLIARSKQKWAKQLDTTKASILYIMRGFGAKDEDGEITPFKEYQVERDDKETETYAGMAQAVTVSRRDPDKGFPCGVCKSQMDPRTKHCPAAKQCFSNKHPARITWTEEGRPVHKGTNVRWIANGTELVAQD